MGIPFTKKILSSSSSGELDLPKVLSTLDVMAERNCSDIEKQQISDKTARALTKIQNGFKEFFEFAPCLVDRQRELEADLKKCQERLRQFSRDHARQSEVYVENITSKSRRSDLERKYAEFCAYEHLDFAENFLKTARVANVDKRTEEYIDRYVSCIIFERSFEAAMSLRNVVLSTPVFGEQSRKGTISGVRVHLSKNSTIRESLKVILKETAADSYSDVSSLAEKTLATIREQQGNHPFANYDPNIFGTEKFKDYLKECCSYSWKLVCQTPPYQIEGNLNLAHDQFDPSKHQVCSGSTPSRQDSRISVVMWPGLFGPSAVVRKAEVLLRE